MWPTCGQGGYVTPAVSGIPTASERGDKIRSGPLVGNLWARWLRHPCRLGDPHRFRAGRQNQKWPTCGQGGYVTPAVSGMPAASERGALVGKVATSPLPSRDPHRFRAGGQNQKWPTCGQGGYVTPAVSGIPTASERGDKIRSGPLGQGGQAVATSPLPSRGSPPLQSGATKSEVAHLWARWLRHPCRLVGSPPLQSGGTKSEVAHLWARWLRHPCRLGDPHRFRAGRQNQKWPT